MAVQLLYKMAGKGTPVKRRKTGNAGMGRAPISQKLDPGALRLFDALIQVQVRLHLPGVFQCNPHQKNAIKAYSKDRLDSV